MSLQAEAIAAAAHLRGWISCDDAAAIATAMQAEDRDAALRACGAERVAGELGTLTGDAPPAPASGWTPLACVARGTGGWAWVASGPHGGLALLSTALRARSPLGESDATVWLDGVGSGGDGEEAAHRRTLANLLGADLPGCVRPLDGGAAAGLRWVASALPSGDDLGRLVTRHGAWGAVAALHAADGIAAALAGLHERGAIHGRLRPGCVYLAEGGPQLAGLLLDPLADGEDARRTLGGVALGAAAGVAPEQIAGSTALDGRTDLYALGCLVAHLLLGRPPYRGAMRELLHQHRQAAPPDLDAELPGLLPGVASLVADLMAKDAGRRPADAVVVRRRIAGLLGTAPTPARGDGVVLEDRRRGDAIAVWARRSIVLGKQRCPDVDLLVRDYPEAEHRARLASVSRRHLRLAIAADGLPLVADLGSTHGSRLDERPIGSMEQVAAEGGTLELAGAVRWRLRAASPGVAVIERGANRPGLRYALAPDGCTIGGGDADVPLPGIRRQVRLRHGPGGWTADGHPLAEELVIDGRRFAILAPADAL